MTASSDFDFSTFPGFEWWWSIITEGGLAVRQRFVFHKNASFGDHFMISQRDSGIDQTVNVPMPVQGDPVQLAASITDGGIVAQEARVNVVWNPTFTLGVQNYLNARPTTGTFTDADRAQLQLAVDNSTVNLRDQAVPPDLTSVPIGKMPGSPPLVWSERVGPFQLIGRGVLDLPAQNVRGIWTGIRWFYAVIPPGWGMRPGAIDEFDARPAQLVPILQLTSGEELGTPILNTNSSGGFEPLFGIFFSGRVAYDVAPGWTVSVFMYRIIGSG